MASSRGNTDQNRPYQGWPYRNPVVIDVPTIDATTAAKWSHLPRKPITLPPPKKDVVINVPKEDGSSAQTEGSPVPGSSQEVPPVVYIPVPDDAESNASTVSMPDDRGEGNPAFVEETIFYDPFENRQIDLNRPKLSPETEEPEPPSRPAPQAPASPARPTRPPPPSNLNIHSPGSSGYGSLSPAALPGYMHKESVVYGNPTMEDGFSLTPLPVNEFSRPPPPYSEIEPPRTEVVVTHATPEQTQPVGLPSSNRKLVQCQHCGLRVHTLVTRENGPMTHFLAFITVILCILPLTAFIYCTSCSKYKVHYCPNCNYKIGYTIPILCTDGIVYTR